MIEMNFDKKYYPAKDEIFSIMFENHDLFERLLNAVLREDGKEPVKVKEPKCQYTITGKNAKANNIRFDVFARDRKDNLYSIDMQGTFQAQRIRNRLTYYACRAISDEVVVDHRYEDLKNVCVTFVMSKYADNPEPIACYQLLNTRTGTRYTDLLTIYEVYAPKAEMLSDSSELKVFLKFFTIREDEDMEAFCAEFNGIELAKVLIESYNSALTDKSSINKITRSSQYKSKSASEMVMELAAAEEARIKAEEERDKANKKAEEALAKSVKALRESGQSNEKIAETLGLTVGEVQEL